MRLKNKIQLGNERHNRLSDTNGKRMENGASEFGIGYEVIVREIYYSHFILNVQLID